MVIEMQILKTLEDVINWIDKNHKKQLRSYSGVNCYFAKRNSSGEIKIFSILKGVRSMSFSCTGPDSVIIQHELINYPIKREPQTLNHSIILSELKRVSIYDTYAEFRTLNSIDFMYSVSKTTSFEMMSSLDVVPYRLPAVEWRSDGKFNDYLEDMGDKVVFVKDQEPFIDIDIT